MWRVKNSTFWGIAMLLAMMYEGVAQSVEQKVCDCVEGNFDMVAHDYLAIVDSIALDMIANNIISPIISSIGQQLVNVSQKGYISERRTYEHILFENIGWKILANCARLVNYAHYPNGPSTFVKMIEEIEGNSLIYRENLDLLSMRMSTAAIFLKYYDQQDNPNELWKLAALHLLYFSSDIEEIHIDLPPFEENNIADTSQYILLIINENDELYLDNRPIMLHDLCEVLQEPILDKMPIKLSPIRATRYQFYLATYNTVHHCVAQMRDAEAKEKYGVSYEELSKREQEIIETKIPLLLIE